MCFVALLFGLSPKVIHVLPCCFSPMVCSTRIPVQAEEMLRVWNMPQHIPVGTPLVWVKTRQLIWIPEKFWWDESPSFSNVHCLFGVFFHNNAQEAECHLMFSYSHRVSCNDLKVYAGNINMTLGNSVVGFYAGRISVSLALRRSCS